MSVTLHGPVSKDQLYKIQEVLGHPSQYRDQIKPEDHPVKSEYVTAFNKFHPKKVEVNEATVEEAIKYGQFLKKSEDDITEAIPAKIYIKHWAIALGDILQSRRRSCRSAKFLAVNNHNNDYQLSCCICSRKIFFLHTNIIPQHPGNQLDCFTIALAYTE